MIDARTHSISYAFLSTCGTREMVVLRLIKILLKPTALFSSFSPFILSVLSTTDEPHYQENHLYLTNVHNQ